MRRLSIHLLVALLTFTVGVLAAPLWLTPRRSEPKVMSVTVISPALAPVEKARTYGPGMHASGRAGKYRACFGSFSSSDGMKFSSTNIYFDSAKRAHRELQMRLKKAIEIVKREPVLDKSGNKVGERVVATLAPYKDSPAASAALIRVEGSDFISVESSSLQNILEYEKDHQR